MTLRGFDDYKITLGDEMRGERACIGKTLEEAERDLCIKVHILAAIENSDLDAFPNHSVVPGYVRSYARYLGMDADRCYERFCEESGFRSPLASFGMVPDPARNGQKGAREGGLPGGIGAGLTQSRFAMQPRTRRIGAPVSLGGLFSAVALVALVGSLGYGGYALLQDIQRVGFVPLPEAPAVVADAPVIEAPEIASAEAQSGAAAARPDASAYDGGGALAAILVPSELEPQTSGRRDGPISAIDPVTSGLFARIEDPRGVAERLRAAADPEVDGPLSRVASIEHTGASFTAEMPAFAGLSLPATFGERATEAAPEAPAVDPDRVTLVAAEEAWVRVRNRSNAVIFEGLLQPGETFDLAERSEGATLRAGNAGGVYVDVGGTLHGPVGAPGGVVKNVSLSPADLRGSLPVAESRPAALDGVEFEVRSAAADLAR